MSTNINIVANRLIQVVNTGNLEIQKEFFSAWQTPSAATHEIMASQNKIQTYKDFILRVSRDVEEQVYANDDFLCEGVPIGTTIYNAGKEHIEELDKWIKTKMLAGYTIDFHAM